MGTSLIVVGCVLIALFATAAPDTHHDTAMLVKLFSRPFFIVFFSFQAFATTALLFYTIRLQKSPVRLVPEIELGTELDPCKHSNRIQFKNIAFASLLATKSRNSSNNSADQTGILDQDTPLIDYQDENSIDLEQDDQENDILLSKSFSTEPLIEVEMAVHKQSHLLGSLYAIIGGIFSSHGMILAKSG